MDSKTRGKRHKDVLKELNLGGKIRELRVKKDLTLKEISEKTKFSTALLSQIENNMVSPPISTLWKIAEALDVKLSYFFQQAPVEMREYFLLRRGEGKPVFRHESRFAHTYYSLGYGKEGRRMDPFIVEFSGGEEHMEPMSHEGEEFVYVLKGGMELVYGEKSILLEEGDSIYFDSRVAHAARGDAGTIVLAVLYRGGKGD